jgi:hypothetical protein
MAPPAIRRVLFVTLLKLILLLVELLSDSNIVAAKIQLYDVPGVKLLLQSCLSMFHLFRGDRSVQKYARQTEFCDVYLLASYNDKMFKSRMRLSKAIFHNICSELAPVLQKIGSHLNAPLPLHLKVAAVLYKLAHGVTNPVVSDLFGIGTCTVSVILRDFVRAVLLILKPQYIKWPSTRAALQKLAEGFESLRGIPRIVGAIDGSHIPIIAPRDWPADYYNRKGFHSILLQGIVDSSSCFWNYDIGWAGSLYDYNLFKRSKAFDRCEEGALQGFSLAGDAAYQPRTYMLTPFLGSKEGLSRERYYWNFIQSSTRMPVECAFGMLKLRWAILLKRLDVDIEFAPDLIACCIVLHNMCQVHKDELNPEWFGEAEEMLQATAPFCTPADVENQQAPGENGTPIVQGDEEEPDEDVPQEMPAYRLGVQYRATLCRLLYDQERARNVRALGFEEELDEADEDI